MKTAAILVLVLCVAAAAGIGWLYLNANITVTFQECIATDAATQQDYFAQLKSQLSEGTFVGTPFASALEGSPEDYQFYTYTVKVTNNAFLRAEVIELQVTPMTGDVLQIGDTEQHGLNAKRETEISATILTTKSMHNVRELTVTYYVWGLPFSTKLTSGK